MRKRVYSLILATTLGCGAAGLGAAPAHAADAGPTGLTTAGQDCATESPGPYLSPARLNSAEAVLLRGTYDTAVWGTDPAVDFQVWDTAHPDQPQDWSDRAGATGDGGVIVQLGDQRRQLDGVTYAWKVRVSNASGTSPWSDTCHYTLGHEADTSPGGEATAEDATARDRRRPGHHDGHDEGPRQRAAAEARRA